MGIDIFQNLPSWKNAAAIIRNYPLLVYKRPGFEVKELPGAKATVLEAPLLEISSTHIRKLIQSGKSIKYLVPEAVEDEIIASRFYKK
jgi:nicotinate-nucleotide adenylyltransferase